MQFAMNYSPQAAQLLREQKIPLDIYKCSPWESLVQPSLEQLSAYVHFSIVAGRNTLPELDYDDLQQWKDRTQTMDVNMHIALPQIFDKKGADAAVAELIHDVEIIGQHFGNENIIIENIPYPDPIFQDLSHYSVDTTVIRRVIEATGCKLLLDIAHAQIGCITNGWDIYEYLDSMPVQHLRELHVTGLQQLDDGCSWGDHVGLREEDWQVLEWVVQNIRDGFWAEPWVMTFEYGGLGEFFEPRSDPQVMLEQAPRLYELAHSTERV